MDIAPMKVVLELQDQPSNVRRITVRHDIVIGRGSDCNLRLSAPQVSRRHCFLRVGRNSVSVTDLDSSNGTFIDGTRVTAGKRYDIANGAQLALGPIRFIIHVRSDVAVAETANSASKPESKHPRTGRDTFTADDSNTINARMRPDDSKAQMDYAIEQAGESAEPQEPTADYLDEQFSANGSANPLSSKQDPADSRLGMADFGKRLAEQSEVAQETNDFPDADIFGKSVTADEEPQWDSNVVDSSDSPENVDAASVADDDVESAWLSVDDDDTLLPEPMNLGNAYVGESPQDAFNDVDADVIEEVEEIDEVMEVHEFEEFAEVQESLDVEEVVEVEDALEEVVIGEAEEVVNVEEAAEIQAANELEEFAVVEEAADNAQDIEVQDWLNFDEVAEVQETLDVEVEEVVEVEDTLDEVVMSETDDVAVMEVEVEDFPEFEEVEQIQESTEVTAAVAEPPTVEDAPQIAVEDGGDSNWFASDEVSESDAFFDNFISPEPKTDNTSSAEAAEEDDDIDPDLQSFLRGF